MNNVAVENETICTGCQKTFISTPNARQGKTKCPHCLNLVRCFTYKQEFAVYKGGKCGGCGYDKSLRVLGFYWADSLDPNYRLPERLHKSWELAKLELDKCLLLCMNCRTEQVQAIKAPKGYEFWPPPKDPVIETTCKECGVKVSRHSKTGLCLKCVNTQYSWPSDQELERLVWSMPLGKIAKQLGVCDASIRYRCNRRGIGRPPMGFWRKMQGK